MGISPLIHARIHANQTDRICHGKAIIVCCCCCAVIMAADGSSSYGGGDGDWKVREILPNGVSLSPALLLLLLTFNGRCRALRSIWNHCVATIILSTMGVAFVMLPFRPFFQAVSRHTLINNPVTLSAFQRCHKVHLYAQEALEYPCTMFT